MADRIATTFARCAGENRAALVTYVMAGDPDLETSLAILRALPAAGADIVELGLPFTDPMADGPAIQAAGLRALKAGQTTVQDARSRPPLPRGGRGDARDPDGLLQPDLPPRRRALPPDARQAGIDGLIVVDLPPEEDEELCLPTLAAGLAFIRLATPTTDERRLPAVLANTSGFVYYVSITGITGAATPDFGKVVRGRRADQAAHAAARGGGLRRQACRARGRDRGRGRRRRGRLGARRGGAGLARRGGAGDGDGRWRPSPSWCGSLATGVRSVRKRRAA